MVVSLGVEPSRLTTHPGGRRDPRPFWWCLRCLKLLHRACRRGQLSREGRARARSIEITRGRPPRRGKTRHPCAPSPRNQRGQRDPTVMDVTGTGKSMTLRRQRGGGKARRYENDSSATPPAPLPRGAERHAREGSASGARRGWASVLKSRRLPTRPQRAAVALPRETKVRALARCGQADRAPAGSTGLRGRRRCSGTRGGRA